MADSRPPSRLSQRSFDAATVPAFRELPLTLRGLEQGLRQRQLDAIAFFLKSKENVFVNEVEDPSTPPPPLMAGEPDPRPPVTPTPPTDGDPQLELVDGMISLVFASVQQNIQQVQLVHFSQQVLHLARDYLQKVTKIVIRDLRDRQVTNSCPEAYQKRAEVRLTKITDHIESVKSILREIDRGSPGGQGVRRVAQTPEERRLGCVLSDRQRQLVQLWDSLDKRALTVEGILNGEIPLLQKYLLRRYGRQEADLTLIIEKGLEEGLAFIQDRDIASARNMFANMGFDPDSKLTQICLYTPDRQLRDYLTSELQKSGTLSEAEQQMISFVHTLEKLYSCPSFDVARVLREEGQKRASVPTLSWPSEGAPFDVSVYSGDLLPSDVANSETASYSHVLLEWLRHWDADRRGRIVLEHVFSRRDAPTSSPSVSVATTWDYLCCHLDVTRLTQWIALQFPRDGETVQKATWPYNQAITRDMIESLRQCPIFIREKLTDDLARRGYFVPWEQSDLDLLISRLSKNAELFRQPSVVEKYQTRHNVTLLDIHYHMIKFCLMEKQPELLYFYLDFWKLCSESSTLEDLGFPSDGLSPWVSMLLHFRRAASLLYDPGAVFEASLANHRLTQKMNESSVFSMLEQGLVVRAMATLSYSPGDFQQLVSEASESVIRMLAPYPQLQYAFFGDKLTSGRSSAKITVYDLLETNAPFDVSRLFGWQSTNNLAADAAPQTLPHFSHEPLVAKYAHRETLGYAYYLKQGRPCYAFCAFLMENIQSNNRVLSWTRVYEACLHAILLSVKHFTDPVMSAGCCAFVGMLGIDGTPQRLHLEALANINKYLCAEIKGDLESRRAKEKIVEKELAKLVQQCICNDKRSQVKIMEMLTTATYWHLNKYKIQRTSFEASLCWNPAVLYSVYHKLPMCSNFLRDCATDSDWLMFLAYTQMHQFPTAQVLKLVSHFPSPNIREHLTCIVKSTAAQQSGDSGRQFQSPRRKRRERVDPRTQLYSKIGVSTDQGESTAQAAVTGSDDMEAETSGDEKAAPTRDVYVPEVLQPVPDDLFSLLQGVATHKNPAYTLCTLAVQLENPVLSVLAGCHEVHNPLQCLGSWLLASCPDDARSWLLDRFGEVQAIDWTLVTLATIRDVLIGQSLEAMLLRGFWIFQPDCLLVPYLRFHMSVLSHTDKATCVQELMDFKKLYWKRRSVSSPETELPPCPLIPVSWVEETIAALVQLFFKFYPYTSVVEAMLECLDELSILRFFECKVLDVSKLLKLEKTVKETGIPLDYVLLGDKDHVTHQETCQDLICTLKEKKFFTEARVSAEVLGMPTDDITIEQLNEELASLQASPVWDTREVRSQFWGHAGDMFCKHRVKPELAAQFFLDHIELCSSHAEKAEVLKLSHDWLNQEEGDSSLAERRHGIFIKMWRCRIHDHLEQKDKSAQKTTKTLLCKEQLLTWKQVETAPSPKSIQLTDREVQALCELVGRLIDAGQILEAGRVVENFGCGGRDLDIVLNCLKLAKGLLTPDRLQKDMRRVLSGPQPLRLRRISTSTGGFARTISMVSVSSLLAQTDVEEEGDDMSTLITIQNLCQACVHGKNCAAFILTVYRIAVMLNQRFDWVLVLEDFALIHRILSSQSENRYMLAKAYIVTSGFDDTQVAGFLCDAVVEALQFSTGLIQQVSASFGTDTPILLKPCLDSTTVGSGPSLRKGSGVQELIQMCQDPAVLGTRLLDTLTSMVSANTDQSRKMLTVEVELLIYANDCFTLSCHMEGISAVLRTARSLVQALLEAEEYLLMISLLTGIGRYSEMTYIFDVLKQNYQFELLFRKGIDRDSRLRLAILDYLQRSHPDDLETYSMAALNFTMYREIGRMLEERAVTELKVFAPSAGKSLENTSEHQATLKKAIRYYSDAAESYLKENCLRHAESCVKQARLVALQSQLLPNKERVLHLDRDAIRNFVLKHKFYEAYILCEAYNSHSFWSEALYHQSIKGGSLSYLQDLRTHLSLTPSIILEVAERYRIEATPTKPMATQMRKLLSHCHDLKTTYKIATLLGFSDVIKELRADPFDEAFLKDTGIIRS